MRNYGKKGGGPSKLLLLGEDTSLCDSPRQWGRSSVLSLISNLDLIRDCRRQSFKEVFFPVVHTTLMRHNKAHPGKGRVNADPSAAAILLRGISSFICLLNYPTHWFLTKARTDRSSYDQGDLKLGHLFSVAQEICVWSGYWEKQREPDQWS